MTPDSRKRVLVVSIHDVMPETIERCRIIYDLLVEHGIDRITLLVVPGRDWDDSALAKLRTLVSDGAILAGHGWTHNVSQISGLYHQLHSRLLSRDVAEHLALDEDGICELVSRCHRWFVEHELPVSDLYVPPAWALGRVRTERLAETPFRLFETFFGVLNTDSGRFDTSPMVGFEADTWFRKVCCESWNRVNLSYAGHTKPVRVAIHPGDLQLLAAKSLRQLVERGGRSLTYNLLAA